MHAYFRWKIDSFQYKLFVSSHVDTSRKLVVCVLVRSVAASSLDTLASKKATYLQATHRFSNCDARLPLSAILFYVYLRIIRPRNFPVGDKLRAVFAQIVMIQLGFVVNICRLIKFVPLNIIYEQYVYRIHGVLVRRFDLFRICFVMVSRIEVNSCF